MADADNLKTGDVIDGKYRIEKELGKGGFGAVYKAFHLQIRAPRAIKVMLSTASGVSEEALTRFRQEARAAGGLRSEHTAKVYDIASFPSGDLYIVMEYVDGTTLKAHLKANGRLAPSEAALMISQACESMLEAHEKGIVHRDLKPENMMLTKTPSGRDCLKVLDFGIARVPIHSTSELLNPAEPTKSVIGTPYYMSPEQFRTPDHLDGRADLWALGVILYELVTGRKPFKGALTVEMIGNILAGAPELPSILRPDLPREMEDIILKCLRKAKEERFQSAKELMDALAPFVPARQSSMPSTPQPLALNSVEGKRDEKGPGVNTETIRSGEMGGGANVQPLESPAAAMPLLPGAAASIYRAKALVSGMDVEPSRPDARRRTMIIAAAIGGILILVVLVGVIWSRSTQAVNGELMAASGSMTRRDVQTNFRPEVTGDQKLTTNTHLSVAIQPTQTPISSANTTLKPKPSKSSTESKPLPNAD